MSQVDEGLIHAWLDGQLPADEAARIETLVATDPAWGSAVAEARGFVAGASRVLGALDTVPSVRQVGSAGNATAISRKGPPRSWLRAPWLRAAAVIVVVAGVGGVTWSALQPAVTELTIAKEKDARKRDEPSVTPAPVVAQRQETDAGASSPAGRAGPAPQSKIVADEAKKARADDQVGARSLAAPLTRGGSPPAEIGAVRPDTSTAGRARGGSTAAGQAAPPVVTGSGSGASAAVASGVSPLASTASRANEVTATRAALPRDAVGLAKSAAAPTTLDPRLAGCWAPVDTSSRAANELRDRDAFVIRFIEPIVTDFASAARPPAAPPPSVSAEAASNVRIQNTMARATSDSGFVAEWLSGNARTQLTFTVRADTIRGGTRLSTGDVSSSLTPFRAVRMACPR